MTISTKCRRHVTKHGQRCEPYRSPGPCVVETEIISRTGETADQRELQSFIERAVILTNTDVLQLPLLRPCMPSRATPVTLADAKWDHVLKALEDSDWVVGGMRGAAARLGVKRTTLKDEMRRRGALYRAMNQ